MKIVPEAYEPTIEDTFQKTVDGRHYEIVDTAGFDGFSAFRQSSVSTGDAFLIVYSVAFKTDYEGLEVYIEDITKLRSGHTIPIAIVANKVDLVDSRVTSEEEGRRITARIAAHETLNDVFKIDGPVEYFETSAKMKQGVDDVFHWINANIPSPPVDPERPHHKSRCFFL